MSDSTTSLSAKAVFVILDRRSSRAAVSVLRRTKAVINFMTIAHGTAGTDLMSLLGLDTTDKVFIGCICSAAGAKELIAEMSAKMKLKDPGRGIAFTIPINGINRASLDIINSGSAQCAGSEEEPQMSRKYCMIIAIVKEGFVEAVMDAAKSAGARGGTVLHGRSADVKGSSFLGIDAFVEREIVTILSPNDERGDIMRAVSKACGMDTDAGGMIVSLPVESIEGLAEPPRMA